MDLGAFSVSLAVEDIGASKESYEKLGFEVFGGDASQNWLIMKNGDHAIGLSIGFGFPAAMGAWCAAPDRPIIAVTGDGGFGQYMGEFTTAVKYGMNIMHLLLNNSELGKISKEQRSGVARVGDRPAQSELRRLRRQLRGVGPPGHPGRGAARGDAGGAGS